MWGDWLDQQGFLPAESACVLLADTPRAVAECRRFALDVLGDRVAPDLADDCLLVLSELVTNALRHGMPVAAPAAAVGGAGMTAGVARGTAGALAAGAAHSQLADAHGGALRGRGRCLRVAPSRTEMFHGICVELRVDGARILASVHDPGAGEPRAGDGADPDAESGRGLMLVDACSDAWGWAPKSEGGKAVWAMFRRHRYS
ncbi:ATP-binding protein [Allostreptomyces psammosilenae]|uniref:Anti-sigma regulatory factor (Ser/Thr protein kinase) n=1 Tax=Allostreptomyces psammosilenae TaxID=1892865 RepID=A0A853A9T9_9ACTN|nr:ATP-binding protein [Allostreptomyces psammosilenae]NYI07391.1 anti-sigma regulatory factor (Ser/Thr protein kinase) [Allostreptomyces psammosilenae]